MISDEGRRNSREFIEIFGVTRLNVLVVVFVFNRVAAFLPFEIHFIFFAVGVEHVVRVHAEHLRERNEKMKQVNDLDARVLPVESLILRPPFPRHAVGELGDFLRHRATIIQNPFCLVRFAHAVGLNADAFVQGFLHAEQFAELVGFFHAWENTEVGSRNPEVRINFYPAASFSEF